LIEIYHNPRCSKSREALELLQTKNLDVNVILYLNERLTISTLKRIIKLLKISPKELIRTNEAIWKEQFKNTTFSDAELIKLMIQHPKLIERPIIINKNKAVIGRPSSKILDIL
jgi:arsenate reductase